MSKVLFLALLVSPQSESPPVAVCLASLEMAFQLEAVIALSHEWDHYPVQSQVDYLLTAKSFTDERGKCKLENPF